MDNQIQNIDQSIREKFENFAPAPPAHVWEGVLKGVAAQTKPSFFASYGKQIAIAASVLLLTAFGLWWMLQDRSDETNISEITDIQVIEQAENNVSPSTIDAKSDVKEISEQAKNESIIAKNETPDNKIQDKSLSEKSDRTIPALTDKSTNQISEKNTQKEETSLMPDSNIAKADNSAHFQINSEIPEVFQQDNIGISNLSSISLPFINENEAELAENPPVATEIIFENTSKSNGSWSSGIYLTTEFMLNDFDSVQLLPTYSLNYEPTYHFSNHFFIRFGAGLAYARDRGFAKIDYISNEVVGTYEDVYDITFDSIDGVLVPTYHTKTTEVWDSVQHIQVSEITNKYLYLQTPALFGYFKEESRFNWYVYGGPAFNVLVSRQIENPQDGLEGVNIIDLENNLPDRSPYFLQLWVGAGIEYKVGQKIALSIEPNYRYYFNNVYKNDPYKSALSSFSLRFGVVFTMK